MPTLRAFALVPTACAGLLAVASLPGCGGPKAATAKPPPPAVVAKHVEEKDLASLVLTPEAEQRLGVQTVPIELKPMPRERTVGGELLVPLGRSVIVSAPVGGTLTTAAEHGIPLPGSTVKKGQAIFALIPMLSPERAVLTPAERARLAESRVSLATSQIESDRLVEVAKVQEDAARITLERAENLLREQVGSARVVDDAKAQLSVAQKTFEAARARREFLNKAILDAEAGTLSAEVLKAPMTGMLRNVSAAVGQNVNAGAPLFEVTDNDHLWVRVPVYVGDLTSLDTEQDAQIGEPAPQAAEDLVRGKPVAAPPSANALAATADLYYEIENPKGAFRPGQMVNVTLPLKGQRESLVIPWSAIVTDIYGGTWVYEQTSPQHYSRRRVQVRFVRDGLAALASGPPAGSQIATVGVEELFGTEFGFGK